MFLNLLTGNAKNCISVYEEPCKSFYTLFLELNSFWVHPKLEPCAPVVPSYLVAMAEIWNTSINPRLTERSPWLDLSVCDFLYGTVSGEKTCFNGALILERKTGP